MILSGGRRKRGFAVPADKLNLTANEGNNKFIDFRMALVPLLGKPATRDIPGGKLPSEGDFLQLLHGEVEDRGGFRGFRGIGDLCCTIRKDKCQCDGGENVGLEAGGEGGEGGSGGEENAL